ncbi:MAG TPA: DUF222 domain-containing protein [Acidimicrobiales bacterium]|nr:DUF222 domain-containing protein [Acidimicrobiales bacterium]
MTIIETTGTAHLLQPDFEADPDGWNSTSGDAGSDRSTRPRTRVDLAEAPTEHLEAELSGLVKRLHFGTYELLVLVGELDARGSWVTWGALSCAAWLADLCDIEVGTARTQVRVAHALRAWPALDEAMADGTISYAKARTLAAHLTDDNIEALVDLARTTPAGSLGAAIAAWSLGHEDQEVIDARHYDERALSWRTDPDGMVVFTLKVPPEQAGKIQAIIDTEVMCCDPAKEEPGGGDPGEHDPVEPTSAAEVRAASADESVAPRSRASQSAKPTWPSLAQQRVDALVRILDSTGHPGTGTRRSVAEVVVHVRPEGNSLADGTPLSDHAVGRLLPEAFVSLLMEDNQRRPIDASPRRRFPTRRQRRVVDACGPECAQDGCHARDWLQYDHVDPYDPANPNTVVANLQRLCGPHNRAKGNRTRDPR